MPPHEEDLTGEPAPGLPPRLSKVLLGALVLQVAILAYQHTVFLGELFAHPSRLLAVGEAPTGSSAFLALAVSAVAGLWARRSGSGGFWARLGQAGLVLVALLGLAQYAAALAAGRLVPWLSAAVLVVSGAAALWPARGLPGSAGPRSVTPRWTGWDALSGAFLATLFVPSFFPYIHYDTMAIWACRAAGFGSRGFWESLTTCLKPNYPPLFSILLALGVRDPLFQGRLLPWLLVVFFALFVRERFARVAPSLAAPALLFLLSTVHVWQGAAMYYADVALMAFLSAGALLVLDARAERGDILCGTVLLGAAVLVRVDGIYYLGVVAVAAAWSAWKGGTRFPAVPLAGAVGVWASWGLRPEWLKKLGSFLSLHPGGWKSLAATPARSLLVLLGDFLNGWQGQWLSHKGLGVAIYLLAFLAVLDARSRRRVGGAAAEPEARLHGAVALLSLCAVVFCFAAFPFVSDPVEELQPGDITDYRACYLNFIRVGLGRMTIHLYPFLVLWALAVIRRARTAPA